MDQMGLLDQHNQGLGMFLRIVVLRNLSLLLKFIFLKVRLMNLFG